MISTPAGVQEIPHSCRSAHHRNRQFRWQIPPAIRRHASGVVKRARVLEPARRLENRRHIPARYVDTIPPPMTSALPVALIVATYLLGSIPFSFLVPFAMTGKDIRQHGSRNVGATNVARTFGKAPGVIALLLDIAKGYFAVEVARWLVLRPDWPLIAHGTGASFIDSRE